MKKYISILMVLILAVSFGGCAQIGKVLYPSARTAEFYYDRVEMTRDEVKEQRMYDNLFIHEDFDGTVSRNAVKMVETKKLVSEEPETLVYAIEEGDTQPLNLWLNDCEYIYSFGGKNPETDRLESYVIKSTRQHSTYYDYLRIMRALTLQYGECTTEMYRSGDATINTVMVSLDIEETKIQDYYNEQFADGNLYLQSKWVLGDREIRVFFDSPGECGIVYVF